MQNTILLTDCKLTTLSPLPDGTADIAAHTDAALVIDGETIAWCGARSALPAQWQTLPPQSCRGLLLTPGLVDAYTALAPQPAGTDADAVSQAIRGLTASLADGVTWREFKTGFDTDTTRSLHWLALGRQIQAGTPQRLSLTLRVAHLREDADGHDEQIEAICTQLIPQAHAAKLVDAVEALCEELSDPDTGAALGFSLDDVSTILEAAYRKKIPTRLGCERLSDTGGAALAPSFYARCAAHLNHCDALGVDALAQARTVAVLLPLAQSEGQPLPPVAELRRQGIPVAVGTSDTDDASPPPTERAVWPSPLLAARRACSVYGLTPAEAFAGVTVHAARVLGGPNGHPGAGTLSAGAPADLALWDASDCASLLHSEATVRPHRVWVAGREIELAR